MLLNDSVLRTKRKSIIIPDPVIPELTPIPGDDICFDVNKINVLGSKSVSLLRINDIVTPYQHQCLSLAKNNELLK